MVQSLVNRLAGLVSLALCLCVFACGDKDPGPENCDPPAGVVGKWELVEITVNGEQRPLEDNYNAAEAVVQYMIANSDGSTCTEELDTDGSRVFYECEACNADGSFSGGGLTGQLTIDGDSMTISADLGTLGFVVVKFVKV